MVGEHLEPFLELLQHGWVPVDPDLAPSGDDFEFGKRLFKQVDVGISFPEEISGVNIGEFEVEFVQKAKSVYKCPGKEGQAPLFFN